MSFENFLMEVLITRVPKDSPPRKESVAETLDIEGSTKSDTTFIKWRELVEKELLNTTEKTT